LKGERGRGTLEKERPPLLGMIERGGQVVIRMLSDVKQQTIKPLITKTIDAGTTVMTDEYDIYNWLPDWGGAGIRRSAIARESMLATKTEMVSMKYTSIPSKASGCYCDPGCALIGAFHKSGY
jgi:ISXO2-like transposase domain